MRTLAGDYRSEDYGERYDLGALAAEVEFLFFAAFKAHRKARAEAAAPPGSVERVYLAAPLVRRYRNERDLLRAILHQARRR